MEGHFYRGSFKESLLLGGAIGAACLLIITLFFMIFYLRQSDIASRQLLVAQRVALDSERERDAGDIKGLQALTKNADSSVSGSWDSLAALHLLVKGGSVAGLHIPGIEPSEISFLLKSLISLRQARENLQPGTSAYLVLTLDFSDKIQALLEALAFRALSARSKVWVACWLLVSLVAISLFAGFFVSRIFWFREKRLMRERQSLAFAKDLLLALPEAIIVLDKFLSLKFVNRLAERYFGGLSGFREKIYFGRFCQNKSLLESLQNSLQHNPQGAPRRVIPDSCEASLGLDKGQNNLVKIKWYQFPLAGQDYLLGMLNDYDEDRQEDLNLAIAQERLKDLTNNLFRAQDDERRLLADELHDGLCQSLAALKMQVFSVERHIDKVELQEECRRTRQFIAQIIEDVRRLSHDLSPVILDDLGLSDALVHLVNNFTALNNLKASIAVPDLDDIFAGDAARNIYRIVQEAINNVGKHAKASLVLLEAEIAGDEVRFSIKDDGVGFDMNIAQKGRSGAGLGLASMAQRVHILGGKFTLVSHPGDGCKISFTLPKK